MFGGGWFVWRLVVVCCVPESECFVLESVANLSHPLDGLVADILASKLSPQETLSSEVRWKVGAGDLTCCDSGFKVLAVGHG